MPEGPELRIAANFINKVAKGRLFGGKVIKSEVSKNPDVPWDAEEYQISAESRGKELKIWLHEQVPNESKVQESRKMSIVFRFGMSGCFKFSPLNELPKHAHLRFFTKQDSEVLSFVDYRRFGRWEVDGDWGEDRGPCPMTEYEKFRQNVIENLEGPSFSNKPICEVMLNQKYFNGIGNYLRAEILYRAKIPPFAEASSALVALKEAPFYPVKEEDEKTETRDLLYLSHSVPLEVLQFGDEAAGYNVDRGACDVVQTAFDLWLRCYQNPLMKNLVDHNKRTIWFEGEPGPLVPKVSKSRRATPSKRTVEVEEKVVVKSVKIKKPNFSQVEVQTERRYCTRSSARSHLVQTKEL